MQIDLRRHQCVIIPQRKESESLEQEAVENKLSAMTTELTVVARGLVKKPPPEPPNQDPQPVRLQHGPSTHV